MDDSEYFMYDVSGVDYFLYGETLTLSNFLEHISSSSSSLDLDQNKNEEIKICIVPSQYVEGSLEEGSIFSADEESNQLENRDIDEITLAHEENATEAQLLESCEFENDEKYNLFVDIISEDVHSDEIGEISVYRSPEYFEDSSMEESSFFAPKESSSLSTHFIDKGSGELNIAYEENATVAQPIERRECKLGNVLKNLRDKEKGEKCKRFLMKNFGSNLYHTQEQDPSFANLQSVPSPDEDKMSLDFSSTLNITHLLDHKYAKPFEEKEIKASGDDKPSAKIFCECLSERLSEQTFTCNCGYQNLNEVVLKMSPQSITSIDSLCSENCTEEKTQESKIPETLTRNYIPSDDNSGINPVCSNSEIYNKKESPTENSLEKSDSDIPRYNYSDIDSISLNSGNLSLSFSNTDSGCSCCSNSILKSIDENNLSYNKGNSNSFFSKIMQNTFEDRNGDILSINPKVSVERNDRSFGNFISCSINSKNKPITICDANKQMILKKWGILGKHNSNRYDSTPFNSVCRKSLLRVSNSNYQSDECNLTFSSKLREKYFSIKYSNSFQASNISENNSDSSSQSNSSSDLSNNSLIKATHPMAWHKYFESSTSSLSSSSNSESFKSLLANISENPLAKSSTYFQFYNIDLDFDVSNTIDIDNEYHSKNSSLAIEELRNFEKLILNLSSSLEDTSLQFLLENSSELTNSTTTTENSFNDSSSEEYYTCDEFEDSVIYTRYFDSSTPCKISHSNFSSLKESSKLKDFDLMEKYEPFSQSLSQEYLTCSRNRNSYISSNNSVVSTTSSVSKFSLSDLNL